MNKTELKKEIRKQIKEELKTNNDFIEQFRAENLTNVLKNYLKFCARIEILELEINKISEEGYTEKHTNSIGEKVQSSHKFKDKIEQLEDRIEILEKTKAKLIYIKKCIDISLEAIKYEEYSKIINMFYFEKKSIESICNELYISRDNFDKIKNKLLKLMKSIIFI